MEHLCNLFGNGSLEHRQDLDHRIDDEIDKRRAQTNRIEKVLERERQERNEAHAAALSVIRLLEEAKKNGSN